MSDLPEPIIDKTEQEYVDEPEIEVGQWYWIDDTRHPKDENGDTLWDEEVAHSQSV